MLGALVEDIVHLVEPAFAVAGYWIIAAAVLMERSIFVGLLVPGDVILALGGVYASRGEMDLLLVVVIGTLAAIAGESAGYWLGRRYGMRLIRRLPVVRRLEAQFHSARRFFHRYGGWTVAVGRYATAAGAFVPFTAGVAGMNFRRFLAFDVPAIVLWAAAISSFGYLFGKNLPFVDRVVSRFGLAMLGLLVGFFLGRFVLKRWRAPRGPQSDPS